MIFSARFLFSLGALSVAGGPPTVRAQNVTIGGTTFTNKGLVGVGRIANSKRDKFGETFGSLSGLALDVRSLQRNISGNTYTATLYAQPDRGFVKSGVTLNYRARTHKIALSFNPDANGSSNQDQLTLTLVDTTFLTESDGRSLTGIDPSATTTGTRAAFAPKLPQAFNGNLSLDAEGLVLLPDGSFFVSDEYGPYLYRFSAAGILLGVIRPPEALIPRRNNVDSFSSDNPAAGQPNASPVDPTTGRANNKGLEGLSLSADGRTLYALMQAAPRQDTTSGQNRFTRLLAYDVSDPTAPTLTGEWVLPLPLFSSSAADVAEAHEIVALDTRRFLVLAHDGNGRGSSTTKSTYRAVLIYDLGTGANAATNIARSSYDSPATPLAQNGILANNITPATSAVLIDLNDSAQLAKFGLNNSASDNSDTLSNAWESLALLPSLDSATPDDFFLLVGNDNNFSTSSGFQDGSSYSASPNLDTMVLSYRVTLPGTSYMPIITTQPTARSANPGQAVAFTVAATGTPSPSFQWSKNGVAIAGATSATLSFTSVQVSDAGSYTVAATNSAGSTSSTAVTLTVSNAPVFNVQPAALANIATGGTVVLTATATGSPTPTYQWRKDGVNLANATSATLVITPATSLSAGSYTVVATNAAGSVLSTATVLAVTTTSNPGRLTNLSVITDITAGVPSFTVGTVVGPAGTGGTKALVVRAAGPSLGALGVGGTLADPKLDLLAGQTVVDTNDNWGGGAILANAMAQVGAFPYTNGTSRDAAIYNTTLAPRDYTVVVSGVGGTTGTAIAEIYDATPAGTFTAASARLTNVSVLKQIATGGSLTLGFTISGDTAKTVLIRAIGPGLSAVGVASGTLSDPSLTLFNSSSLAIATNDNWGGDAALTATMTRVSAFAGFSAASKDAMLLLTLPAGGYTATVSAATGAGGLAIVEVYDVP